jgi:hypothetical protein
MAAVASYYKFKMNINCKGGGYLEDYDLLAAVGSFSAAYSAMTAIATLRGALLEAGSRIANMVLSVETAAGTNPAEGYELAHNLAGVPQLMKDPVSAVLESNIALTSDPKQCIVWHLDTGLGQTPGRTLRSIRSTWVANNALLVSGIAPLGYNAATTTPPVANTPAAAISNFFSFIRDNTVLIQLTPSGPQPFAAIPFAARFVSGPNGADFAVDGIGSRKIGEGWPKVRGRKPSYA